jgi:hypothetical protein
VSDENQKLRELLLEHVSLNVDKQLQEMREVIEGLASLINENQSIKVSTRVHMVGEVITGQVATSAIPFFAAVAIEMLSEQRRLRS